MDNFLDNKYTKLYFKIIDNAKSQPRSKNKEIYFELHHVYPASIYPELEKEANNLVLLTAREHFLCHYLLCKMVEYGSNQWYRLVRAFTFMYSASTNQKRYINSKLYESARKNIGTIMSEMQKGNKNSQFGTVWVYSDIHKHSIKIDRSEVILYQNMGYQLGRKINWKDPVLQEIERIDKKISKLINRKKQLLAGLP